MEHLANPTVAAQGLEVGEADKTPVVAAAPKKRYLSLEKLGNHKPKVVDAEESTADDIVDLDQEIKKLNKDDAIARLLELEERHEKTFFEIGGVLSAIQKNKWFDPFASLDEWVEKNMAISRAKARALIQIYDAIVESGVKWAKVKHLSWTKLRAIAGVLAGANADHWIQVASNHSKAEIIKLVREHLVESAGQKPGGSIARKVKTFKFRGGQIEKVEAAIDLSKEISGAPDGPAALEFICQDFIDREAPMASDALVIVVRDHLKSLDESAAEEFGKAVRAIFTHDLESHTD